MIIPDANLLLYAVNRSDRHHEPARLWIERLLSGTETVGFAWIVVLAFLRLSTRPGIFATPLPVAAAFEHVSLWLTQPNAVLIDPGPDHLRTLHDLLSATGTAGNLTSDAHLAAIAIEQGATLHSADSDYARFRSLRWMNPLAPSK